MSTATVPPRLLVCTFATAEFAGSAELLRHTALHAGGADEVHVYRESDVAPLFEEHPDLLPGSRGHGWWAWKPWCILRTLRAANPGDAVVYCDAAVMATAPLAPLAPPPGAHARLFRLGGWSREGYRNEAWTKRDAFAFMGLATPAHRAAHQLNAGVQAYRAGPAAEAFVGEYLSWCVQRRVVDDACAVANYPGFRDHRHDQSVLSLLAVGRPGVAVSRDPTQHGTEDPETPEVLELRRANGCRGDDGRGDVVTAPLLDHHRARRRPVRVAVVTPTRGGPHLAGCVASVQAQALPNVHHYVVVDGPEHEEAVRVALAPFAGRKPVHVLVLPHNVGAGGWNGHRAYGSMPWLVDGDYVAFLDDDNAMDPDHLLSLVKAVTAAGGGPDRPRWAYSLRRIVDREGREVCRDSCESLGGIAPTVCGRDDRLIDTSCYLLERDLAIETAAVWNARFRDPSGRPEPDRELAKVLLSGAPHACVRRHTLAYRVDSTAASVGADFFVRGNALRGHDFEAYDDLYVFHFSPDATRRFLETRRRQDRSYALDEWQMTLLRGLDGRPVGGNGRASQGDEPDAGGGTSGQAVLPRRFNLLDGYECAPNLPPGSAALVCLCQPDQVPWDFLRSRPDLRRVAYTLESPNVRHAAQWDPALLAECFDVVLTYADFLLKDPRVRAAFCPHNTHHLDLGRDGDDDDVGGKDDDGVGSSPEPANPCDAGQLDRVNRDAGRSVCMVLERRDLSGSYEIPGTSPAVRLECMDPWREALMRDLRDATVFGVGWDAAAARNPGLRVGHTLHRSADPRHAVDIVQDHTFVVIVENCLVDWYCSEKFWDALLAGAIPLYMGSVPPQLGVPEGVEDGVYVDLRRVLDGVPMERASAALQAFLDGLTDGQIRDMKARVLERRADLLRRVGVHAFADAVRRALSGPRRA